MYMDISDRKTKGYIVTNNTIPYSLSLDAGDCDKKMT